jgi:cytochrome c peroxidase
LKKLLVLSIIIALVYLMQGCRKDPSAAYSFTPYNFNIPTGTLPSTLPIPADNKTTEEGVALGRMLFYDPILSDDNTQSCASCHKQSNAFVDGNNQFSKGIDGSIGDRNSMPLFNLMWAGSYFWDGRSSSLEAQALKPIEDPREMKSTVTKALKKLNEHPTYPLLFAKAFGTNNIEASHLAKALAQFERSIISCNSKFDRVQAKKDTFTTQELKGYLLFINSDPNTGGDCIHCHVIGSTFTDFEFRNNGLDAVPKDKGRNLITGLNSDIGKFKTPTLRNIAVTAPYMHDGRFNNLADVIDHYNLLFVQNSLLDPVMQEQAKDRLTEAQKADLIAFLHTLTDSTLLTNPAYAKP